jgi:hypothetical protein
MRNTLMQTRAAIVDRAQELEAGMLESMQQAIAKLEPVGDAKA